MALLPAARLASRVIVATAITEQVPSGAAPRAKWFMSGPAIVAGIACLEFPIHLANPGGYGFFIDEL